MQTRRIAIRILIFLALVTACDRALHGLLAAGFARVETGDSSGLLNSALKRRADVVILGNSRARAHYIPAILADSLKTTVYNAGCPGQEAPYIFGAMDLLLRSSKPGMFIINVDGSTLAASKSALDRAQQLAPYIDQSEAIETMLAQRGPFQMLKFLSRSYRYNSIALQIFQNLDKPDTSESGFVPLSGVLDPKALPPPPGPAETTCDEIGRAYFERALDAAKAAGTRVVLVRTPSFDEEYVATAPLFQIVKQIAAEKKVDLIEFDGAAVAAEFAAPDLYADRAHFNRAGAERFSRLLAGRLATMGYCGPFAASVAKGPAVRAD